MKDTTDTINKDTTSTDDITSGTTKLSIDNLKTKQTNVLTSNLSEEEKNNGRFINN